MNSMQRVRRLLPSLTAAVLTAAAATLVPDPAAAQQVGGPLVIRDVTVIPMDRQTTLPGHTVVVRDGVIERVAPDAEVRVPEGARVIDGAGRYLMPGLVDMHIHVVGGVGAQPDGAWQQMTLLAANGVTTARSLAGAPTAPQVRDAIDAGTLVGPDLYLAGPSLNHQSVTTPDAVRAAVRQQAEAGFDFIKTHGVSSAVYDAMVQAAAEAGVPLAGHVTPDYGLFRALEAGQQIEHLDGYLAATIPQGAPVQAPPGQVYLGDELDHMDEAAMAGLARRTVEAGVWNSPTLALFEVVADPQPPEHYLAWPDTRYVPARAREAWSGQMAQMAAAPVAPGRRERYLELRRAMTRALRDAGAGIMAGSDSPQFFLAPGFALHRELRALQAAGLTPYEVLAAATVNPARYIGESARFGVVAEGHEADLLLLEADPLEDVANAARIAGVVLDGRWLPASEIAEMKAAVAAAAE